MGMDKRKLKITYIFPQKEHGSRGISFSFHAFLVESTSKGLKE